MVSQMSFVCVSEIGTNGWALDSHARGPGVKSPLLHFFICLLPFSHQNRQFFHHYFISSCFREYFDVLPDRKIDNINVETVAESEMCSAYLCFILIDHLSLSLTMHLADYLVQ